LRSNIQRIQSPESPQLLALSLLSSIFVVRSHNLNVVDIVLFVSAFEVIYFILFVKVEHVECIKKQMFFDDHIQRCLCTETRTVINLQ